MTGDNELVQQVWVLGQGKLLANNPLSKIAAIFNSRVNAHLQLQWELLVLSLIYLA